MNLYHYTSVPALNSINTSNGISEGYLQLNDNSILKKHCWYTTSPSALGHGLTDGTEKLDAMQESFFRMMNGFTNEELLPPTQNKHAIRISVDSQWLQSQRDFYKFTDLVKKYNQPEGYALRLGLSALNTNQNSTPPFTLMHETWYVHTGVVPHNHIISIEALEDDGHYRTYDFEKHGRKEMARNGSFSISPILLADINSKSDLKYNGGDIFCFFRRNTSPQVCFQHKQQIFSVYLDNPNFVLAAFDKVFFNKYGEMFIPWVNANAEELKDLWRQSEAFWVTRKNSEK